MRGVRTSLLILNVMLGAHATAGVLKCASHTITGIDARNAMSAAVRAAGASHLDQTSLSVCMNPGVGRAWFTAAAEPQADESILQPHIDCERGSGRWRCEKSLTRTLIADVDRAGTTWKYEFRIPVEMSVGDARTVVQKAFDIAGQLVASQTCNYQASDRGNERLADWLTGLRESFSRPPSDGWDEVTVEQDGTIGVDVDFNAIYFRRGAGDTGWQFSCWNILIVVA
jgi:hypothetical protein